MKRWIPLAVIALIGLVASILFLKGCRAHPKPNESPMTVSTASIVVPPVISTPAVVAPIAPKKISTPVSSVQKFIPKKEAQQTVVAPVIVTPTPAEIHKELIPKNIEIVRVYYANELMGPGSETEFDINGTGFTKEFQQMITVDPGLPCVKIKNLAYVTLNQIHGTLVVASTCPTSVGFPQVLINHNVVFRAPEPFAVIRPGEVLNVLFTEMGESGRSGRFRIYTNLSEKTFPQLKVVASTSAIQITELSPQLPFIVDATIQIGPALTGEYAMKISLGEKTIWERPGVIRIVQPDMGEAGLVQRLRATDGVYRPGDKARFVVQGSGFQPQDVNLLTVKIPGFSTINSSWTFVAPGRMDLLLDIPAQTLVNSYTVQIFQGEKNLLSVDHAFIVVPANWIRTIRVDPALTPGGSSAMILEGRDMSAEFIKGLTFSFDEPGLTLDSFQLMDPTKAVAGIHTAANVDSGDYLLSLKFNGAPVMAYGGNVVRVSKK